MNAKSKHKQQTEKGWFLLLVSFIEGGAVMAVELIGAKMVAPYFGSSLYVWSAVLAVTLMGLTSGYYIGGVVSEKYDHKPHVLYLLLLLSAVFTGIMPMTGPVIMESLLDMDFRTGATLSSMLFILPPLMCFGMVSPIIIRKLSDKVEKTGRYAGLVYAISTVGGILATFIAGFYLIPEIGLRMSAVSLSLILGLIPLYYFVSRGKTVQMFLVIGFLFFTTYSNYAVSNQPGVKSPHFTEVYKSDGLLGQLLIVDYPKVSTRGLFINNISQSYYHLEAGRSQWTYVHRLALYSCFKPAGSNVFLAGLGAGNVVNELKLLKFEVDVCDIEERMNYVAQKYFDMVPDVNFIVDDARHAIKTAKKPYDIVILDISAGENQPNNLYTVEGFRDIKKIMKEDGVLFIHYPTVLNGKEGIALKSIVQTLRAAGYKADLIYNEHDRTVINEFIVFASPSGINLEEQRFDRRDPFAIPFNFPVTGNLLLKDVDFSEGIVMTDDKPLMDKLHQYTAYRYRKDGINLTVKPMVHEGLKMY